MVSMTTKELGVLRNALTDQSFPTCFFFSKLRILPCLDGCGICDESCFFLLFSHGSYRWVHTQWIEITQNCSFRHLRLEGDGEKFKHLVWLGFALGVSLVS